MLSKSEKEELKNLAASVTLKKDMRILVENRHNPFFLNEKVNMDSFVEFLTDYNYFMSHAQKPFHKIIDKDMRL